MKKTIVFLLSFALCDTAFVTAANAFDGCLGHELTTNNACIGATPNCENKTIHARDYSDEYAIQMLVARKFSTTSVFNGDTRGAYFCPIQVEAKNRDKDRSWVEYTELRQSGCVWLCYDGYTGKECTTAVTDSTICDSSELRASNYADIKRKSSGANIRSSVSLQTTTGKCGGNVDEGHSQMLAVKYWLPSGHGAIVQKMNVWAAREGYKDMVSWPRIHATPGADEIVACKIGYKPTAVGRECEPINKETCDRAMACSGWSDFDTAIHVLELVEKNDNGTTTSCYEYKCKEQGYGFPSSTDRTCVNCAVNFRSGVNPETGVCHTCDAYHVFDANATNYCSEAIGYSKTDLQYGKGQNKNTNPNVKNQCWIVTTPSEYEKCVNQGGIQKK